MAVAADSPQVRLTTIFFVSGCLFTTSFLSTAAIHHKYVSPRYVVKGYVAKRICGETSGSPSLGLPVIMLSHAHTIRHQPGLTLSLALCSAQGCTIP